MKWKVISHQQILAQVNDSDLENLILTHPVNRELALSKHSYAHYLRAYLILTYRKELYLQVGFSELDILVNRFCRFQTFYDNYSIVEGRDAGIEDQISNLIAEIHSKYPKLDWENIQNNYQEFAPVLE
jgi:hypothetical protein